MPAPLGVTAVMLPELSFEEQVALCVRLGVMHYQFRPRLIRPEFRGAAFSSHGNHRFDLTPHRLVREGAELSRQLREAEMAPLGTLPECHADMSDDQIALHADGAAAVAGEEGGFLMVEPPPVSQRRFEYQAALDHTIRRYRHIIDRLTRPRGLTIFFETHRQTLVSGPALAWNVCRHFQPLELSVILDIGNLIVEGSVQPRLAVAVLREWIAAVHVGGTRKVRRAVDDQAWPIWDDEFCQLKDAPADLPEWFEALAEAGVRVPVIIEDFRNRMPGAAKLEEDVVLIRSILANAAGASPQS